jgi:hypothetical protein
MTMTLRGVRGSRYGHPQMKSSLIAGTSLRQRHLAQSDRRAVSEGGALEIARSSASICRYGRVWVAMTIAPSLVVVRAALTG